MAQDETFGLFHKYNRLVRRQLVKPLTCEACGISLITGLGPDDELLLICVGCDDKRKPGLTTIENVKAVVKEHFE